MEKEINHSKRNRQFTKLKRYKGRLSSYDYNLIKNWITNWEFMGKTGDKNLMLNIKERLKQLK